MGRPRRHENARLTKKQQTFAELVVTKEGELTLRECAQQAGYSVTSSHTRAYELLNPFDPWPNCETRAWPTAPTPPP